VKSTLELSLAQARRLAVAGTLLDGSLDGSERILDVVRKIGYLQLDPTNAVARSHLIVLFSRLGPYDVAKLERLLAQQKLYEYSAAIVLGEEYPRHLALMQKFPHQFGGGYPANIERWLADNAALHEAIVAQLAERGPLPSRDLVDVSQRAWKSTGWTNERNVTRMLELLWAKGEVLVHGRAGGQRLWALADSVLPRTEPVPFDEVERQVALRSLRGLGVATAQQVQDEPFVAGPFRGINKLVPELDGVERVAVEGQKGTWYAHRDDLKLLDRPEAGPYTTLLSPFDPLIRNRKRTVALWGFDFRLEIYVPKEKRWGFFVLPVLHGDDLVGRIDPTLDRKAGVLRINAIKWEPGAPKDVPLEATVARLADFLGATRVTWPRSRRRP
jgi:uncharacterized protein YcaQ